jgi:hypothetical protein
MLHGLHYIPREAATEAPTENVSRGTIEEPTQTVPAPAIETVSEPAPSETETTAAAPVTAAREPGPVTAEEILGPHPEDHVDDPHVQQDVISVVSHNIFPDLNPDEAQELADRVSMLSDRSLDTQKFQNDLMRFLPADTPTNFGTTKRLLQAYAAFRDGPTEYTAKEIITAQKAYNEARTPGVPASQLKLPIMTRDVQVTEPQAGLRAPREAATTPPLRPIEEVLRPKGEVPPAEAPMRKVPSSSTGLAEMGQGMGQAITKNLRDMLWDKFQRGETTEAGAPSNILLTAAREKAAGRINNRADFEALVDAYSKHLAEQGRVPPPPVREASPSPPTEAEATQAKAQGSEPWVSKVANEHVEERVKAGELGEIAPGEGYSTHELVKAGSKMHPEEVAQHISNFMNDAGGDMIKQASAIRYKEAELSKRSSDLSKIADAYHGNAQARLDADKAFEDVTNFHKNEYAKLKKTFQGLGMSMQGKIPIDLSTFNGQREEYLKTSKKGEAPPAGLEKTMRQNADKVKAGIDADNVGMKALGDEVSKATTKERLTDQQRIERIMQKMGIGPCRT